MHLCANKINELVKLVNNFFKEPKNENNYL